MTHFSKAKAVAWMPLDPARAQKLVDARLQFHHAAQLATALGISYLEKKADDSHTNLEWLPAIGALASNPVPVDHVAAPGDQPINGSERKAIRVAVRPQLFALLVIATPDLVLAQFGLDGRTIEDAARWLRARLGQYGLDPTRFTLDRHYTIPPHPVADGAPFHDDVDALDELGRWYRDASIVLGDFAAKVPGASPVRCWPHHFDIATLIDRGNGKSVGLGMESGDQYYAEPYWYANAYPAPDFRGKFPSLDGEGAWHTAEWTGAVLTGSKMDGPDQGAQAARFFQSALRAYGVDAA
ncbi:MAG TPA: hypothetical protein VGM50_16695 [Gemmatimonadaceae bacterium]